MPLVVICGHPCSGKSTVTAQLVDLLHAKGAAATSIVSEPLLHLQRDDAYKDVPSEKNTRALLKSTVERCIGRKGVTILDSLDNIKGYRYELWCIAKAAGTRYCMVHVDTPVEQCRAWNAARQGDKYSDAIFEDLARRFERPDARNRWDAPLFTIHPHTDAQHPHDLQPSQQQQQQQQQPQPQPHIPSQSPAAASSGGSHAAPAHTAQPFHQHTEATLCHATQHTPDSASPHPPTNHLTTTTATTTTLTMAAANQPSQMQQPPSTSSSQPPPQLHPPQSATSSTPAASPAAPHHTPLSAPHHPPVAPHSPPTLPQHQHTHPAPHTEASHTPHPQTASQPAPSAAHHTHMPAADPLPKPQAAHPAGVAQSSQPHPATRSSFVPAPQGPQPQPVMRSTFKPAASLRAAKQAQAAQAEAGIVARASQPAASVSGRTGAASLVSGTQGSFHRRPTQVSAAAASTASWVHADGGQGSRESGQGHVRASPHTFSTMQDGSTSVSLASLKLCDPSSSTSTQLATALGRETETDRRAGGSGNQQSESQDPLACDDQHSLGACSDAEGEPHTESVLQAIAEAMVGKPVQLSRGGTCQLTPSTATSNPAMMLGTNLLHDVDQAAQDVVDRIMEAQSCAAGGAPGRVDCSGGAGNAQQRRDCLLHLDQPMTLAELRRHKRAFLKLATKVTFARLHDGAAAKRMFVDYLISNVPGASRPPAEVF